jgi:hypothetical protein
MEFNGLLMQEETGGNQSSALEFLPLLEKKLKGLIEEKERIAREITETRTTIDEIKVKLAGGELPLTTDSF